MARGKSVKLLAAIPKHYSPDFMDRLDKRTVLGKAVRERYEAICNDLGGVDSMATVRLSLVRRFVWLESMIEGFECRAAAAEEVDVGTWMQLINSWLGVARLLGLERKAKRMKPLREHMTIEGGAE